MHWTQSHIEKLTSGQIFHHPVSIQTRLSPLLFASFSPLLMKWQTKWLTAEICLLASTHTHTLTHTKTQIHHSCFMWGALNCAVLEGQFPWQQAPRIRVKNCHSRAIVRAPWFRRALRSEGKEQSTGVEMGEFGSVGRIKGEMEEWITILLKIALPPHPSSL